MTAVDLKEFELDGDKLDVELTQAVVGGQLETTIEGASTLTLNIVDPELDLIESRIFMERARLDAAGLRWEFAGADKQDDLLTVTFEQLEVAALRRQRRSAKVARGKRTRAEFYKSRVALVKHPKIIVVCPELHQQQALAGSRDRESREDKDARRAPGIADNAKLKGKEGVLSGGQLRNAERVLDVAENKNASKRATLALLVACIVEAPDFKNPAGGDADSVGILQLRAIHLGGSTSTNGGRRDIELVCGLFLTKGFWGRGGAVDLAKEHPDWSPGRIAQECQGSGFPGRYDQYRDQAEAILAAYGGAGGDTSGGQRRYKKYAFMQGPPDGPKGEDTWALGQRLFDEVGWRRFMVGNRLYLISETDLMRSRPRMILTEGKSGVDRVNFDIRPNLKVDEAEVTCRTGLWKAPPGTVVEVEDMGVADGRWLVSSIVRPLLEEIPTSTITLRRQGALLREKKEPAAEERQSSGSSRRRSSSGSGEAGDLADVKIGSAWGGCESVFEQFIDPFMRKRGLPVGTTGANQRKRTYNTVAGGVSDHFTGAKRSYAVDYATTSGADDARALAKALGIKGYQTGNFNRYTVRVGGKTFSAQILWAVKDHYDHVHAGLQRVG